jgi:hypothetical protein
VRDRVVAHAIPEHASAYAGTGMAATQALYAFLSQRLHQTVIPTGYGITAPAVAADEGMRAQSRAVVMARLNGVDYVPGAYGLQVRVRLELVVVREGRVVMRRLISSPTMDLQRRGRGPDPVFVAVTRALDTIGGELAAALG